jgi:hypothetical protein
MWADALQPSATVHGIDVSLTRFERHRAELAEMGAFRRARCVTHKLDTASDAFAAFAADESALPALDVVIDDGCHTADSQWRVFTLLFPRMAPGGLYVVEDIEHSSRFFGVREACAFGALLGAAANVNYFSSAELQHEVQRHLTRAEAQVDETLLKARTALDGLRRARESAPDDATAREKLDRAVALKEAELDELSRENDAHRARARREARERLERTLVTAQALASTIAIVEVRKQIVAFTKH